MKVICCLAPRDKRLALPSWCSSLWVSADIESYPGPCLAERLLRAWKSSGNGNWAEGGGWFSRVSPRDLGWGQVGQCHWVLLCASQGTAIKRHHSFPPRNAQNKTVQVYFNRKMDKQNVVYIICSKGIKWKLWKYYARHKGTHMILCVWSIQNSYVHKDRKS